MSAGVYLGFDYGTRRIGVAVGQQITCTATTLEVVANTDESVDWAHVDKLIKEWLPDAFVVGFPLNMDGTETVIAPLAQTFGEALTARYNRPVAYADERLTTRSARAMQHANRDRLKTEQLDCLAAKLILEAWLLEH